MSIDPVKQIGNGGIAADNDSIGDAGGRQVRKNRVPLRRDKHR